MNTQHTEKEIDMTTALNAVNGTPWITIRSISPEIPNEQVRYDLFVEKLFKQMHPALMACHAGMGVCGEAGELVDAIKKNVIYGQPADFENIKEEVGDILFYVFATMQMYQLTIQDVLQNNADKLGKRYVGLKYSDVAAKVRADKNTGEGEQS